MKIRNKKTGEVIDLSESSVKENSDTKTSVEPKKSAFENRSEKTEERIKERGTIQESVKEQFAKGSLLGKVTGALEVASTPFSSIESGISNPALELQKGNTNVADLIKQAALGVSLQRQAKYADVMKNAGYNPLISEVGGLVLNLSPVKVFSGVSKTFGNISKMSDKGLMKAGNALIEATNEARVAVGTKVGQEFSKYANNIGVDGLKFLEDISELPAPAVKKLELAFGKMDDFARGLNIGKLREFKTYLGKLKPNVFGKAEHGVQETIEIKDFVQSYGKVKNRLRTTLQDSQLPKKVTSYLMSLEDTFSDVMDARRFIKKSVVDSVMNVPSKVGTFAEEVTKSTNQTARLALNEIKHASSKARSLINKAMGEIESFERWQAGKQIVSHATKAAVYGGVAGGVGGAILRKVQGE